jgi:hypothetical protein
LHEEQVASIFLVGPKAIGMIRVGFACLLGLLGTSCLSALDVGVARCDITPDFEAYKVPLAGYGARKGKPSTAVAMFCNGAEGDQSPDGAKGADAFQRVNDFGTRLAEQARTLAKTIQTRPNETIGIVRITPDLPAIVFSPGAANGPYRALESAAREALPKKAEIQVLHIGNTALVGLPGEPICAVGLETEKQVGAAGFEHVLTIGLANDYLGYIVNEKEYSYAGYEVDERSYYGPGLGSFIASNAAIAARQLTRKSSER